MTDILGTVTTALGPSKKLSKTDFKKEIRKVRDEADDNGEAEKAKLLQKVLDNLDKFDANNDDEITEDEVVTFAKKAPDEGELDENDFTAATTATPKAKLPPLPPRTRIEEPKPPIEIEAYMQDKLRSEGGYLTNFNTHVNGVGRTTYAGNFEIDDPTLGKTTFQMFFGKDNKLHVLIYPSGELKDDTPIQEYAIPIESLEDKAFRKGYFLKVKNRNNSYSSTPPGKVDIIFSGEKKDFTLFTRFIKSLVTKEGTNEIDLTNLQTLKGYSVRQAEGMENLTTTPEI